LFYCNRLHFLQTKPADPIVIPALPEPTRELFPATLPPLECIQKEDLKNFDLDVISLWFSQRMAGSSEKHGRNLFLSSFVKCAEGQSMIKNCS